MMVKHFILATAGHVDHGKSALVKALTGTDPDRLPEEKARGITIDLGFAHLELQSSLLPPPSSSLHLSIVDVPGHEDFVRNMVAGVGSIDLALLVVAADDGWMPQTEEHLQILAYLGVTRAVIALTKIDLMGTSQGALTEEIRERLYDSPFRGAPIIGTSVLSGTGLDALKTAFASVLENTPPQSDMGKPRLSVDRVFTLKGVGTVVTGAMTGGALRRGEEVIIQPSGMRTRIRSIQSRNRDIEASKPGMRAAFNLSDLAVGQVRRGEVITRAELGGPSNLLDVILEKSPRLKDAKAGASRPLKHGTLVRIHHGSGNFPARVHFLEHQELTPGQRVITRLRLESPIFAFASDRFVLRDWSEQATLAGGEILDPDVESKSFHIKKHQDFLKQWLETPDQVASLVSSRLARDGVVRHSTLLVKSRFSAMEVSKAVSRLAADGKAVLAGELVADAVWWQKLRQRADEAIEAEHRAHPERAGLLLNDLRLKIKMEPETDGVFDALLADLCKSCFTRIGALIRHVAHRPVLPLNLQAAGDRLRSALAARPFEPPSRKELASDAISKQALRFLVETGEAIEISDEVILLSESFTGMTGVIRKFLAEHRTATVSELRQAIGTSRRILVPLLERLDRDGITLRKGDQRVLKLG